MAKPCKKQSNPLLLELARQERSKVAYFPSKKLQRRVSYHIERCIWRLQCRNGWLTEIERRKNA